MNQENFEKWLHDLETTDEPQIRNALTKAEGGDCCLGRMCKLAIADGVQIKTETDRVGDVHYDGDALIPPSSVQEWIGVEYEGGDPGNLYAVGVTLNDNDRASFKEIAIEMREKFGA